MFAYDVAARQYVALTDGALVASPSFSRDGSRAAFLRESASEPADVYVSGATFASPRRLTTANPQLAGVALGAAEVITWNDAGTDVEGILLKPVGYQPGTRYPLLVVAHGGPTGAHTDGFKLADGGQVWAGAGWAVLYPNPRGSTNYGERFMRANIGDWGGGDYRDIMTGVDAVIDRGVADPSKLAVMGWSYGGYLTCWIVSQTSRFKAAMMGAGLSDLVSMYGTTDIPDYLGTFFAGIPSAATLPLYRERSGLTGVDAVTTPLLILQGGSDERVPTGQSMEFYRALKDRGKTVELVFYPREGHGLREYYHVRDRLTRQFEWITRHTLGDQAKQIPQ
jgi:dipeptidyl aminopeptidase/acylaminoacyl peptidase